MTPAWVQRQFSDLTHVAQLAGGGQKVVFSARHPQDGDVVVKVIKPGQDVERIQREIVAVQKVCSPRVPRILDVGLAPFNGGMVLWIREQRVMGGSVRQKLSTHGQLHATQVAHLVLQILEALAAAEQARIVHRDVKPENLMHGDDGAHWLLDFGIARHLDLQSLTQSAPFGGPFTVGYAPPEQYRNHKREIDSRADLFALAVTSVECLTGRHPYRDGARDPADVIRRIESTPLAVPTVAGDIVGGFTDLISAMGQRRTDLRPPSAAYALQWMRDIMDVCRF